MKKNYLARLFTFLLLLPVMGLGQQAGGLDRSFNYGRGADYQFNYGRGANDWVNTTALQPDGKIIIGGDFNSYNSTTRNGIARLNADGSLDATFNPGTGPNYVVRTTAVQPDGKIMIGGFFTSYNGTMRNRVARLNADGSLDTTFNPGTGVEEGIINSNVQAIAVQADGKIIIGGNFNSYNGTIRKNIARLNANGSLDATFNLDSGANGTVRTISLQADGKIIIGGHFTTYNGHIRNRIARLNADGSLDTTFNPGTGANSWVYTTALQANGKIIIGGEISRFNGTSVYRIARLNADGSLDTTFNIGTGANNIVYTTVVQLDGKIIIVRQFDAYYQIARLNADGSLDAIFNPGTGPSNLVSTTAVQADGKIIIVGGFTTFNGISRNHIARLNADGSLDATFNPGTGANSTVSTTALQLDGKIIIGGEFTSYNSTSRNKIARLNADGSLDATFNPGTGPNESVWTTAVQADDKIIIGGVFTTYNGTSRRHIARLNANGTLEESFNPVLGANGWVYTIALQADGKIIIGGSFTSCNGTQRNCIARLNGDGSLDATFNIGAGANGTVQTIALQADGKIIIGGNFTSYNGTSRNKIARLNADGGLDTSFNSGSGIGLQLNGTSTHVGSTAIQPDGKIIIGGRFSSYNGIVRRHIARLNDNGSLDQTFNPGIEGEESFGYAVYVENLLLQPDNKIIIGGVFNSLNGISRSGIARLNANGQVDVSFNLGTGTRGTSLGYVNTILLQPDNKLIIGGYFYGYNNFSTPNIARIHLTDGGCTQPTPPTISGINTICAGYTTTLTSSVATGNLWSTGDTTQSITVGRAGTYTVNAILGGCTSAVSAPFVVMNNGPVATTINYDTNSINCLGSRIALTPAGNFAHYLWSNGERTRTINTRYGGTYSVQVANADSCFGSPSPPISISFGINWCSVEIYREGLDSISANLWADYYIWYLNGIELLSSNTQKTIPIQGDGVYTFRAVNAGNTSPLSNPLVITSSKKSLAKTQFEVFPNPATDKVTIKTTGEGTLEILSTLGQVVITQPAEETNEINLAKLAKGVYTVRFNGGSKILVVK